LPEALVSNDQVLAPWRGVAIKGLVDFSVGRVDTDFQNFHQDRAAVGNFADVRMGLIRNLRYRYVSQVDAVGLARKDGDGFHLWRRLNINDGLEAAGSLRAIDRVFTVL
jgi:hypothetical protein